MAYLPKEALILTGGCYCQAIRYTINVPAWDHRPPIPDALETPISATERIQTRMPLVDIDHCNTCRQVSGAVVQCWFISPVGWVEWDLLPKEGTTSHMTGDKRADQTIHLSTIEAVGPLREDGTSPSTYVARFCCTDRATRTFCSRCGTNLTYLSHKRMNTPMAFVDVTVGSLDRESLKLAKADRHGWWDFGMDWVKSLLRNGDGGFMIRHHTGDVTKAVED
ncbi:uncharacterized protein Z518_03028 [Rhinocladiella mackenziei CBS 650.93]|uniref:Rhinocladiella mackenziei CBS 650.93 unplaced genomic scaffold supercont1.2, whole genome shotgun sequence n=1 Tax=Rhinocladiella mackenziei CBS 650.93 TaxID=1442369 RepID=A0A0D2G1G3_9EURO|nr:uncharacterized protein Z518_03028 [Rhinocladiella mackenziei CBS 650.93]KIX08372.1 hypothetical protein Z518_03028 [Rhinocladiella mackenziei CBS 650.93]